MVGTIVLLIWSHFIFDFVLQSDKMALNKSKSMKWLTLHSLVYGSGFLWLATTVMGLRVVDTGVLAAALFVVVTVSHGLVDYFSSRLTSYLWGKGERHWFFVVIGLDQAIHISTLLLITVALRRAFNIV